MAVWLVRAGGHGQFQDNFISENRVYVTWKGLDGDLVKLYDGLDPDLRAELPLKRIWAIALPDGD